MPPKLLTNIDDIDFSRDQFTIDDIRKYNQQRYEMEHLSGIVKFDLDEGVAVGYKDINDDEFWIRGHVPGRPIMPGVIMCESAAQLCSFYYMKSLPEAEDRFLGFGGMQDVKFRGVVVPGDKLVLIARSIEMKERRAIFDTQGLVNGKMVFQARIIGMPV